MNRLVVALIFLWSVPAQAAEKFITLASTTSTQNSGLFQMILPLFTADTGIAVRVVAVGTGQAIRIAQSGDADALLVHHRPSELAFIAQGFGIDRRDVMYNDFVLIGPKPDPANIALATTASAALTLIAASQIKFASRGDDSGTHKKELEIWAQTDVTPQGLWYLETGSGMGATLNLAQALNAYTIADRGSWITFGNKGDLDLLYSGDPALFNPYSIILVNPVKHPHIKIVLAQKFADWLVSVAGQNAIGNFLIDGFQAFCPSAMTRNIAAGDEAICPSPRP